VDDGHLAFMLALLGGSMFFSAAHQALRNYSRVRMEALLGQERAAPRIAVIERREHDLLLATAGWRQICNLLLILTLARAVDTVQGGTTEFVRYAWSFGIGAVLLLVFTVALPFAMGRYAGDRLLAHGLPLLRLARVSATPLLFFMRGLDSAVGRFTGPPPDSLPELLEEEILDRLEHAERSGAVEEQEKEMIEGVFEFGDALASDAMTARSSMAAIEAGAGAVAAARLMAETGHHRLPVFQDNLDEILGVVHARDLLRHFSDPVGAADNDLRKLTKPAHFVPESRPLTDVLDDFRTRRIDAAVVLDEYGGTAGLLTRGDLLEIIVGRSTSPPTAAPFKRISESEIEADGLCPLEQVNEQIPDPLPAEGFDTVGGFVSGRLGHIPRPGEKLDFGRLRFTVIDAGDRRINRLRIEVLPVAEKLPA